MLTIEMRSNKSANFELPSQHRLETSLEVGEDRRKSQIHLVPFSPRWRNFRQPEPLRPKGMLSHNRLMLDGTKLASIAKNFLPKSSG